MKVKCPGKCFSGGTIDLFTLSSVERTTPLTDRWTLSGCVIMRLFIQHARARINHVYLPLVDVHTNKDQITCNEFFFSTSDRSISHACAALYVCEVPVFLHLHTCFARAPHKAPRMPPRDWLPMMQCLVAEERLVLRAPRKKLTQLGKALTEL